MTGRACAKQPAARVSSWLLGAALGCVLSSCWARTARAEVQRYALVVGNSVGAAGEARL